MCVSPIGPIPLEPSIDCEELDIEFEECKTQSFEQVSKMLRGFFSTLILAPNAKSLNGFQIKQLLNITKDEVSIELTDSLSKIEFLDLRSILTDVFPQPQDYIEEISVLKPYLTNLRKIDFSITENEYFSENKRFLPGLEKPFFLNQFKNLQSINFRNYRLSNYSKIYLPSSLEELDLRGNNLGSEGLKTLRIQDLKNLKILRLSSGGVDSESLAYLAPRLPESLVFLELSLHRIGIDGAEKLAKNLPPNLDALVLNPRGMKAEILPLILQNCPQSLTEFDLDFDGFADEESIVRTVQMLPDSLKYLRITGCDFSSVGMRMLMETIPSNIEVLKLPFNSIQQLDLEHFLSNMPVTIKELDLSDNLFDGNILSDILYHLPKSLKKIDVSSNLIKMKSSNFLLNACKTKYPKVLVSLFPLKQLCGYQ